MSEYGLLQEVRIVQRGAPLTVAAAVSDTELVVDTALDFNYDPDDPDTSGGTLDLNGARLAYTSVLFGELPDDPDTVVLAAPLAVAADVDDFVGVVLGGQVAEDWEARVTMGEGDAVVARLTVDQRSQWPVGVYADPVPVVLSDDLTRIEDAPGRTAGSRVQAWNLDEATADADDTAVTIGLTFTPLPNSLQVKQNGVDLIPAEWTLDGRTVTIAPADELIVRAGQTFSAYYLYDEAAEVVNSGSSGSTPTPDPTIVGSVVGTLDTVTKTLTFDLAAAAAEEGDLLVVTARGGSAPGGGEITLGLSCTDARVDPIFVATEVFGSETIVESVFAGFADGSGADLVVDIIENPDFASVGATGALAVIRGINGIGTHASEETSQVTPRISGTAAVAVTWNGNGGGTGASFPPDGYTDIRDTGIAFVSTDISYWTDPLASQSPAGNFLGEGCVVIALT